MGKKKDIGVFGDPSYLVKKFADISKAVRSEKSQLAKDIKVLVKSKSTKKDNMYCYGVIMTSGVASGVPVKGVVVHVGMGLNGPGRDSDYFAALKRLTDTKKFRLLDAHIDACDDLWDFLFIWQKES